MRNTVDDFIAVDCFIEKQMVKSNKKISWNCHASCLIIQSFMVIC